MNGKPWEDLQSAFRRFLEKRKEDQATNAVVTVIQFSHTSRIIYIREPFDVELGLGPYDGGNTIYSSPLVDAFRLLLESAQEIPVLIFMSDGDAHDGNCFETWQKVVRYLPRLEVHTVGFGLGTFHVLLQVHFTCCHS